MTAKLSLTDINAANLAPVLGALSKLRERYSYGREALSLLNVEIIDPPENTPFVLIPGFAAFAKSLLETVPDFIFYGSVEDNFMRSVFLAANGNISAVQRGDAGAVVFDGNAYVETIGPQLMRLRHLLGLAGLSGDELTAYEAVVIGYLLEPGI